MYMYMCIGNTKLIIRTARITCYYHVERAHVCEVIVYKQCLCTHAGISDDLYGLSERCMSVNTFNDAMY